MLNSIRKRIGREIQRVWDRIRRKDRNPPPDTDITGEQHGFVWKPYGEHTNRLVVLIPQEFTRKTMRIMTLTESDGTIERSNRAHDSNPQPNGDREHYRFRKAGENYRGPVTLHIVADGIDWEWTIPNPARRYDHLKATRK